MVSGFDSFGLEGSGAGFVSVFYGGGASFRFSGGGGEVYLGFQRPSRQPSSEPRERSRLRVQRQYL